MRQGRMGCNSEMRKRSFEDIAAPAAIDHGKSAVEAVEYAATRDHDTGGDVQSVDVMTKAGKSFDALMREADTAGLE